MKKKWIRPVVLVVVFLATVILFGALTNKENEEMTTTMAEATLPIVRFYVEGTKVDELHGYTLDMDIEKMRDGIIPLDYSRKLDLEINRYEYSIDKITYELRSLDGSRLLADGQVEEFEENNATLSKQMTLQNVMEPGQEYMLHILLWSKEKPIHYYTRVMVGENYYTKESLEFVKTFHEYTFSDQAAEFIPTYMDAATGDASTLNYVDLSCTLKQIAWASLKPTRLTEPVISYKEITSSYNVLTMDYVVAYKGDNGQTELYNVEEYYRLRQAETRMYVLNFERRINQIFSDERDYITAGKDIQLGIRNPQVEYNCNESGEAIAFVQEGELWTLNSGTHEMAKVFSFRGKEGLDARDNWNKHDIKIMRIDESGSVDFIVYGYMNRGDHEGEVGIGMYHYDGLTYAVEEEAFLPVTISYEVLSSEIGNLMYQNESGIVYLTLADRLYRINLETLEMEALICDMTEESYAVSESNRFIAWVENEKLYASDTIHVMDLRTEKTFNLKENGKYIKPLGFIEDDFIYGIAETYEVKKDIVGTMLFPMKELKIVDVLSENQEVLKEYVPQNGAIGGISVADDVITVELISSATGQAAGIDTIMNREAKNDASVYVKSTVTEVKETQYQLAQQKSIDDKKIKRIVSKEIVSEKDNTIVLDSIESADTYYVYVKGDVVYCTKNVAQAIMVANEKLGVVVDEKQNYVWKRARKTAQNSFAHIAPSDADAGANSLVQSLSAMLKYYGKERSVSALMTEQNTPKSILIESIEDKKVLDLTGCNEEEILFYLSEGSPVFAMTDRNSAVLLVGYSASNIYYYNPELGTTNSMSHESASELFENAGNVFFSYH